MMVWPVGVTANDGSFASARLDPIELRLIDYAVRFCWRRRESAGCRKQASRRPCSCRETAWPSPRANGTGMEPPRTTQEGQQATWLEHVTDDEYGQRLQ